VARSHIKSPHSAFALFIATVSAATVVGLIATVVKLPAWLALSMVLLVVFLYPIALNRTAMKVSLRLRRGLCPTCAYDRRGLAAEAECPECGTPCPPPPPDARRAHDR